MQKIILATTNRGRLPAAAVAGIIIYAAGASLLEPFTWPIRIAIAIPSAALLYHAVNRNWHLFGAELVFNQPFSKTGIRVWVALIGIATVYQLYHFIGEPRAVFPTLSALFEILFRIPGVRAVTFGLWLWLGWYILDR